MSNGVTNIKNDYYVFAIFDYNDGVRERKRDWLSSIQQYLSVQEKKRFLKTEEIYLR